MKTTNARKTPLVGRKAIHVALVTSAGLRPNANADVVQAEIRLADLFRDA